MISQSANTLDQTFQLSDGRTIGYAEYGHPLGKIIFFFHGQPGNRYFHPPEEITRSANIRLIVPDRPGYGLSSCQPGRRITDWASDIQQLALHLGTDRFPVIGFSAGGPYALACAAQIPDLVSAVVLIGSAPPIADEVIRWQLSGIVKANYFLFTRAPWLAYPYFRFYWKISRRNPSSFINLAMKNSPPADQLVMDDPLIAKMLLQTWIENLRIDPRGYVEDAGLLMQDWGFDLNAVKQDVHLVWGSQDRNSPPSVCTYLGNQLPSSSIRLLAGEGHFGFLSHWESILKELSSVF